MGFPLKNVYVNKTSGSSGDPFIFAKDKFSHALTWANIINRFGWHGIDFNSSYQARFYGIPLDFIGNRKERFKDFLSNRFRFSIFDLSDEILEEFFDKIRNKKIRLHQRLYEFYCFVCQISTAEKYCFKRLFVPL